TLLQGLRTRPLSRNCASSDSRRAAISRSNSAASTRTCRRSSLVSTSWSPGRLTCCLPSALSLQCRPTAARPAIPIVMLAVNFDPIARGYVQSLAQPGGYVTGIVSRQLELAAKQVELLTEAFPERKR